ncbi:MAG: D-glycero-alpha-D-manno-heptose-7-phosphate kinase [Alphaproteobacteria bacterium]|nr:MAG: D-glycero-alpha-D-manno-heptose-7-phosphate kinase [Caulobacteraceae bacterium]TPW08119.1 MAG: D-glycero-alpha-D-manno-heptose-7-phosphate kinase [Alphaproteobacteria bacterium]
MQARQKPTRSGKAGGRAWTSSGGTSRLQWIARRATAVLEEQLEATKDKKLDTDLGKLYDLVEDCVSMLEGANPNVVAALGAMLDESWQIKRRLSSKISNPEIDNLYAKARAAGAHGGKLCGAGGGGFLLMLAPPDRIPDIVAGVAPNVVLPIRMDYPGSTVIMSGVRPTGASLAMSNRPMRPLRLATGG